MKKNLNEKNTSHKTTADTSFLKRLKRKCKRYCKKHHITEEHLLKLLKSLILIAFLGTIFIIAMEFLISKAKIFFANHPYVTWVLAVCLFFLFLHVLGNIGNKPSKEKAPEISDSKRAETYKQLQILLYSVMRDECDFLDIKRPKNIAEIAAQEKTTEAEGIVYYNYKARLQDKDADVDTEDMRELIETEINNLYSKKASTSVTSESKSFFNGVYYPGIIVRDVSASRYSVDIVLVLRSEQYIHQLHRELEIDNQNFLDISDDYDDDF